MLMGGEITYKYIWELILDIKIIIKTYHKMYYIYYLLKETFYQYFHYVNL